MDRNRHRQFDCCPTYENKPIIEYTYNKVQKRYEKRQWPVLRVLFARRRLFRIVQVQISVAAQPIFRYQKTLYLAQILKKYKQSK